MENKKLRSWSLLVRTRLPLAVLTGFLLVWHNPSTCLKAAEPFTALGENHRSLAFLENGGPYLELSLAGWGPSWTYAQPSGKLTGENNRSQAQTSFKIGDASVVVQSTAEKSGSRSLRLEQALTASSDTALTLIALEINPDLNAFAGGKAQVTDASGKKTETPFPFPKGGLGKNAKECLLIDATGKTTRLTFDPPCDIASDHRARVVLAEKSIKASTTPLRQTVTVEFAAPLDFFPTPASVPHEAGFEHWFAFQPTNDTTLPSEISLADWLEKPAGKHGRITREGDRLLYNSKPFKIWGMNTTYAACAPEKDMAEKRAAFYAKHGINSIRLHKFADGPGWAGIQSKQSFVELDPAGLDRMDYFIAQLKQRGIFTKLSPTFGVKFGRADLPRIPYADELGSFDRGDGRIKTGGGIIYLAEELQNLQIDQMTGLLRHVNSHTGLSYAQDPAIAVIELFNEDSALFFNTMQALQKSPTLRRRTANAFHAWLEKKYGTKEALLAAWGQKSLGVFVAEGFKQESWEEKFIVPAGNPWFYDPDQLEGLLKSRNARLLDTMQFFYELQNNFYNRYADAIRATGYSGEILASNWQAGRASSHFYNLHSDRSIGMIDRHNYFGGARDGSGRINPATMLRTPGSGILSSGMQQVADRPFMLSEWIHVTPNEWGVEGPAILGAYGMGLQGWDASYIFQNSDQGRIAPQLAAQAHQWNETAMAPQILGIFPAVSRQVLRGDILESETVAPLFVHFPSLAQGKLGFVDRIMQEGDVKTFTTDKVPAQALAAVRCAVAFTDTCRDTPAFDLQKYTDGPAIRSSTGQLAWRAGTGLLSGFFTIDTPATKAVVGFAQNQKCVLGGVTVEPLSHFGAIYLTAKEKDGDISNSKNILLTAIARARNTGMKIFNNRFLLEKGASPILMEPVCARITLDSNMSPFQVILLDHNGGKTNRTIPVKNGSFTISGARDKTCYYLITR